MTNPAYFWIVYPSTPSKQSYNIINGSTSSICQHVAFIQGGTPGSIRYFKTATTLSLIQSTDLKFSIAMNYIRFKIV